MLCWLSNIIDHSMGFTCFGFCLFALKCGPDDDLLKYLVWIYSEAVLCFQSRSNNRLKQIMFSRREETYLPLCRLGRMSTIPDSNSHQYNFSQWLCSLRIKFPLSAYHHRAHLQLHTQKKDHMSEGVLSHSLAFSMELINLHFLVKLYVLKNVSLSLLSCRPLGNLCLCALCMHTHFHVHMDTAIHINVVTVYAYFIHTLNMPKETSHNCPDFPIKFQAKKC